MSSSRDEIRASEATCHQSLRGLKRVDMEINPNKPCIVRTVPAAFAPQNQGLFAMAQTLRSLRAPLFTDALITPNSSLRVQGKAWRGKGPA